MLNEIMSQLANSYNEEDYIAVIEDIYEDIYDEVTEDEIYATVFKEEYPFEIKKLITNYLNHENFQEMHEETKEQINKSIINALEILKKYNTPEYICLVENNFYNEPNERPPYTEFIHKPWHIQYKQNFINQVQEFGIQEQQALKMIAGLESIISN